MAEPTEETATVLQDTGSEAEALKDILAWSKDCPAWQCDALRRLCTKGELGDADLDDLTDLCKDNGKGGAALASEHIPAPESAVTTVNLTKICGVANVNALKDGQRLAFDKKGLTVVYGDNGSGKSGYARILKKVCRARMPKDDKILPNIYATETGPQKAVIGFSANGHRKTHDWTAGQPGDRCLSSISVFDSHTANVHVDRANDVAYTPFPMRVLEQLAEICQKVKDRIQAEIQELKNRTPETVSHPECHDWTKVGKLIAGLGGKTKEQDVHDLAELSEEDKARLDTLKTDLGADPAKVAVRVDALKNRLNKFFTAVATLQDTISDEQVSRLKTLYQAYQKAKAAATAAADNLFADDPLPDIGSEVWHTLWKTARCYSEQNAYPDMSFPFTGDAARCVLCQQELDAEAVDRLNRFEDFVRGETKRKEEEAEAAYQTALSTLSTADNNVRATDILEAFALIRGELNVRGELNDSELAKSVRRAAVMAKWRLRGILRNHMHGENVAFPATVAWPVDAFATYITALSTRIAALRADDQADERKQMRAELAELEDREWLAVIKNDIIAEIGRRERRAALGAVLKDTKTNRITSKSGEIAERLVTNALRAQFSKEIDKFGIAGMAVELRKTNPKPGVPHFQVSLTQNPDAHVGGILSEGEHRCVALAAFLAELATTESRSAIVFDDPVSSLDHMHRKAVADRLAEEGQHRQIIVFTHDIAFLFLLDQACRKKGTCVAIRSVTRTNDHAGVICDPPARAQAIEEIIKGMQKQLEKEKHFFENGDRAKWENTVDAMYKRLRSTWERAVEKAISPVFERLSNKVETRGLAKVTALTIDDCTKMREAYGRCSMPLHSVPASQNPPLLKPETVQSEITALRDWVEDIKKRQEKIKCF